MLMIGPHLSIAKGYQKAAEDAVAIGANTFQFFSRNPRGSSFRAYDPKDAEAFQALRRAHGFGPIQAHLPYTVNLASKEDAVHEFGTRVLKEDIARMDQLDIEYLVFHPGSHTGLGVEEGLEQVANALNGALDGEAKLTVLLETMSGKGTEVGFRFEHLRRVMAFVEHKGNLGVCMDLCHVYAAGYDVRDRLDHVLEELDRHIGLENLKSIHLNDSLYPIGSGKDRHVPLGEGAIGLPAILEVLRHPALARLPFYAETPLDLEGHHKELDRIKASLGDAIIGETLGHDKTETARQPE